VPDVKLRSGIAQSPLNEVLGVRVAVQGVTSDSKCFWESTGIETFVEIKLEQAKNISRAQS
jgi:hypothetical protein